MLSDLVVKPRRCALYVPVNNSRALSKAPSLAVDVLIYDFEDAILPDQKDKARKDLAAHLSINPHQCEVVLRVNPVNTGAFYDDIEWLRSHQQIDSILLPKVRDVSEVELVQRLLQQFKHKAQIWILVETIDAVLNLGEITAALQAGAALVLGGEDLAKEMRIRHTPGRLGLLPVLTQLVLHGRRAGLSIIDAVFTNIDNELGFRQACEQAKNLGFDGKSLIHPGQIRISTEIFSPSAEEVKKAEKIITAWKSKPAHLGIVTVDNQVVEQLHVDQAKEFLKIINSKKLSSGFD